MSNFVRCKLCKVEVSQQACDLAGYKTVIDGSEYFFCCKTCLEDFKKKKRK